MAPSFFFFFFFFFFCFIFFCFFLFSLPLPPFLLFQSSFPLDFLFYHTISCLENQFSRLPNLIFIISLKISLDLWVFEHLWKTHFQTFNFFLSSMVLPPRPPKFLTFHGKRYDPSIEWIDEEGLLQDPLNHAPYPSTKDLKVSSLPFVFVG